MSEGGGKYVSAVSWDRWEDQKHLSKMQGVGGREWGERWEERQKE